MKKKLSLLMVAFIAIAAFAATMSLKAFSNRAAAEVTDVLTRESLGLTQTDNSYADFTDKTITSEAVYAGNAATNNGKCIQLRVSNSKEGIVSTTSGGTVKSIKIEWNEATTIDTRTVDVYGSATAYSTAADLYKTETQGTKIASFTKSEGDKTIEINGDYQFVGIRSNTGALYIDKITIVWETEASAVEKPKFSPSGGTYVGNQNVEITCATEGAKIYYTTDGTEPTAESTAYTTAVAIDKTTTLKAIAVKDNDQSNVATAEYTILESIANTEATAYTVAEALGFISSKDAAVLAAEGNRVYVKGTIKTITEVSTEYGNATYIITDDDTNELTIFRGKYLGGVAFDDTNKDELAVGKIVVVKGNLLDYEKDGVHTPEMASGNELVSIQNPPVPPTDIVVNAEDITGGDITAALSAKTADVAKVGDITINLSAGVTYTVSGSL
ncbi:MAG: chitobiase/beta-hexosaminidase C-terminal domain-containing protein, partial [Prevotella sp.]|nr:chitobiase/beta-hexosaminidase C-terminal domain-containing protein [Prevotella sp.]